MSYEHRKIMSRGSQESIDRTAVTDEMVRLATDTSRLFFDLEDGTRIEITDFVKGYTEAQILALPYGIPHKIYISMDTRKLYTYDGYWQRISDSADFATYASIANSANHADTATYAENAGTSEYTETAGKAIKDKNENDIVETYAPISSPEFSGNPTAPLASGLNEDVIANVKFVKDAISTAIDLLKSGSIVFVESYEQLPEEGEQGILYLVPADKTSTSNLYKEYIWTGTGYEVFGTADLNIDGYFHDLTIGGDGNAITDVQYDEETDKLVFDKGATFLTQHPAISTEAATTNASSMAAGETFEAITAVTRDKDGHVTSYKRTSITLPDSVPNAGTANYASTAAYAVTADTATFATNAGTSTHSTNSGTADYATNAGTANYATNADSASYADMANGATYAQSAGTAEFVSGKVNEAAFADEAGYTASANEAIHAVNADTADYATSAGTATHASTATYADVSQSASSATYAANAGTAEYVVNAGTTDYATNAGSSDYATNAGTAEYVINAGTTAYAETAGTAAFAEECSGTIENAVHAENADSATYAENAGTSDYATNALNAENADSATYAGTAAYAQNAFNAESADSATNASTAGYADTADYANRSSYASTANNANTATYAENAGTSDYATNAGSATYSDNASTATEANHTVNADYAEYATNDADGNSITATYAPLLSAALTGTPTTPTPSGLDDNTIANVKFVKDTVEEAISLISSGLVKFAASYADLPIPGEDGVLYLVSGQSNLFTEYFWDTDVQDYVQFGTAQLTMDGYYHQLSVTGDGNAVTNVEYDDNADVLKVEKNTTFLTQHPSISTQSATTSASTASYGSVINVIDSITKDNNGHVTKYNTKSITLPNNAASATYATKSGGVATNATFDFGSV